MFSVVCYNTQLYGLCSCLVHMSSLFKLVSAISAMIPTYLLLFVLIDRLNLHK